MLLWWKEKFGCRQNVSCDRSHVWSLYFFDITVFFFFRYRIILKFHTKVCCHTRQTLWIVRPPKICIINVLFRFSCCCCCRNLCLFFFFFFFTLTLSTIIYSHFEITNVNGFPVACFMSLFCVVFVSLLVVTQHNSFDDYFFFSFWMSPN